MDELDAIRQEIDTEHRSDDPDAVAASVALELYGDLVEPLLDASSRVGDVIDDHELRIGLSLADAAARQINTAQLVLHHAVGHLLMSPNGLDTIEEIRHITGLHNDLHRQAEQMDAATGRYSDLPGRAESADLARVIDEQVRGALATNQIDLPVLMESLGPQTATSEGGHPLYVYQDSVHRLINERASELDAAAQTRLRTLLIAAGVTSVATVLVVAAARSLTRPLRSLREQASAVAGEELPGTGMRCWRRRRVWILRCRRFVRCGCGRRMRWRLWLMR